MKFPLIFAATFTICLSCGFADVTPLRFSTDHAVLQQEVLVPVWGSADPGEEVVVKFGGQELRTKADAAGLWKIVLEPLAEGVQGTLTITGNNTIELQDILVGEVWLCSGQSGMVFKLATPMRPLGISPRPSVGRFACLSCVRISRKCLRRTAKADGSSALPLR